MLVQVKPRHKLISENLRGRGLYLAFNKAIAHDAQNKSPSMTFVAKLSFAGFRHVNRDVTAKISLPGRLTPSRFSQ